MLFNYQALTQKGEEKEGTISSFNKERAITSLQQRGLTIVSIVSAEKKPAFLERQIAFLDRVPLKEIVMISRQISTLFLAHVSALRVFRMLAAQSENKILRKKLTEVGDDIQGGSPISDALAKHPKVFSPFYVNMVRSGEETGKLSEIFESLAGYLDRSYELTTKIRNALIYPGFVISTFLVVMALMLAFVFPNLANILIESGQEIPIYTRIIMGISDILVNYGLFILILLIIGGVWGFRYARTQKGRMIVARVMFATPILGKLFQRLYLSRIADNMHTLLLSGINIVRALEITGTIVGNIIYENILKESMQRVKGGSALSDVFSDYEEIPVVMVQIIKVGEETGDLGGILSTLAIFYKREVDNAVDTLINLIEPMLIVGLGLGVGIVLTSVLVPIYNISTGI